MVFCSQRPLLLFLSQYFLLSSSVLSLLSGSDRPIYFPAVQSGKPILASMSPPLSHSILSRMICQADMSSPDPSWIYCVVLSR
jgi:hypothetical protein